MYSKATCQRVGPVGVIKRLVFVPRCKMIVRTVRGRHFTRGGGGRVICQGPMGLTSGSVVITCQGRGQRNAGTR